MFQISHDVVGVDLRPLRTSAVIAATVSSALLMLLLSSRGFDLLELLLQILAEFFMGEPVSFLTESVAIRYHFASRASERTKAIELKAVLTFRITSSIDNQIHCTSSIKSPLALRNHHGLFCTIYIDRSQSSWYDWCINLYYLHRQGGVPFTLRVTSDLDNPDTNPQWHSVVRDLK